MKKLVTLLLVFVLVFSPVFCSGQREVNLKTIFFGDKSEIQTPLSAEKPSDPSSEQSNSETNLTVLTTSPESSDPAEMTTDEIVDEIISVNGDAKKINTETLKSLVVVKATNNLLKTQIADAEEYTVGVESDLADANQNLIDTNLIVEKQDGEINTLNEKLKQSKDFKFVLLGANYNVANGYGVSFDTGVKFGCGLMSSVGVSAPISALNMVDALDLNSYTFNTKIGFAW